MVAAMAHALGAIEAFVHRKIGDPGQVQRLGDCHRDKDQRQRSCASNAPAFLRSCGHG
jgi:superoxide dismutase